MKSRILALALVVGVLAAGRADAALLRSHVTVDDAVVRLGDLFDDAGSGAEIVVAQAPAPGHRIVFDANTLFQVARAYGVAWRPQSRFDRAVVERAGRIVPTADIVAPLKEALVAEGMQRDAQLELANRRMQITVALDAPSTVNIRSASFDRQTGRFSAIAVVGADEQSGQRVALSGRAYPTVAAPVLRRAVNPGEIIRKDDVEIMRIREDQASRDVILDAQHLIGMSPRVRLRPGEPVRAADARPPILVERNGLVTIVLQTGNMTLSAQGRASEDGAKGDSIRVVNLQSKKTIEAVVAGPDLVTVQLGRYNFVN